MKSCVEKLEEIWRNLESKFMFSPSQYKIIRTPLESKRKELSINHRMRRHKNSHSKPPPLRPYRFVSKIWVNIPLMWNSISRQVNYNAKILYNRSRSHGLYIASPEGRFAACTNRNVGAKISTESFSCTRWIKNYMWFCIDRGRIRRSWSVKISATTSRRYCQVRW